MPSKKRKRRGTDGSSALRDAPRVHRDRELSRAKNAKKKAAAKRHQIKLQHWLAQEQSRLDAMIAKWDKRHDEAVARLNALRTVCRD
jgi:16S rRNA G1207 methylase RsmC